MKKLLLIPMFFLCACSTSNSPSSYTCTGSGRGCHSIAPQQPNNFVNAAVNSNNNITSMQSRNEAQVVDYIKNRLIGLSLDDDSEPDYLQIAQLSLWLSTATEEDIDAELVSNKDNIHRAMYVYNSRLNTCFEDNASVSISQCFLNWKSNASYLFNNAVSALELNGKILSIDNARFTSSNANDEAVLQFGINEAGKIVSMKVVKNSTDETEFVRYNDTNKFTNTIDNTALTYNSVGKNIGLKYSDFGTYDISSDIAANERHDVPFAGGYPDKSIPETNIATDLSFSGKAAGTVTSYKNGVSNPQVINLENGRAFLTFDKTTNPSSPTTKITANFDNWYMVLITKGETDTINFESYKENAEGYDMKMLSPVGVYNPAIVANTTTVNYYAEDPTSGIPTEATGLTTFRDCGAGVACTGNYDTTPEIKLDMSFGVH